jgi:hypothetical protein
MASKPSLEAKWGGGKAILSDRRKTGMIPGLARLNFRYTETTRGGIQQGKDTGYAVPEN